MRRWPLLAVLPLCWGVWAGSAGAEDGPIERGRSLFNGRCQPCHRLEPGRNLVGPSLAGMLGRPAGTAPGFTRYSKGLAEFRRPWDDATLDAYLLDPKSVIAGNRMIFTGLQKPEDRQAVISFLKEAAR